jgi:hypothetical protein
MTQEELLKYPPHFRELIANFHKRRPKVEIKAAEVTPKLAAAARANPASVQMRVSAEAEDGTTVIERVRKPRVEVVEVDAEGRPKLARSYDPGTGEWGVVEYEGGYQRPGGAVSTYNLDGLKGAE